ncbi:MAG TPA: hypothetical protein VIO60_04200 [Rectinemataceae bacterium]
MKDTASGWTFARTGGVDQVVLKSQSDLERLKELDPKLWAVLALPTDQPDCAECLRIIDADKDGKVRVSDMLRTIEELKSSLASLDILFEPGDALPASLITDPIAKEAAVHILGSKTSDSATLGLAQVDEAIGNFSQLAFNGDGILDPDAIESASGKALANRLIGMGYSKADEKGKAGVDGAALDRFSADASARLAWLGSEPDASVLPLDSLSRSSVLPHFAAIEAVMDDYYRRCGVVAMSQASEATAEVDKLLAQAVALSENQGGSGLAALPLAMPRPSATLELGEALNPHYAKSVAQFFGTTGAAFGAGNSIDQETWEKMKAAFSAYAAWLGSKPGALDGLSAEDLSTMLSDPALAELGALIEKDESMAAKAEGLRSLRRLLVLRRDFLRVLKNCATMDDFYKDGKGLFRAGRLYIDGRELGFCLEVKNPGNHGTMAGLSSMYLIYCNLSRLSGEKKSIVAALTAGDADNIFVGRNGVFIDSEGADWDAVITKVVVQPISIREAFFSPYKWFVRSLEELAMKRAANAEAASMDKVKAAAAATANVDKVAAKPDIQAPKKMDVGTVAAIGVALGSIGAMVTGILGIFVGMGVWMPLGIMGIFILISGPSMILAYMKLRKRNIGPLLNAEGWAVNGRLKINVPFGATLSHLATLPAGSTRQILDPFAEKKKPWALYALIALVVGVAVAAYFLGWLDPLLGR